MLCLGLGMPSENSWESVKVFNNTIISYVAFKNNKTTWVHSIINVLLVFFLLPINDDMLVKIYPYSYWITFYNTVGMSSQVGILERTQDISFRCCVVYYK